MILSAAAAMMLFAHIRRSRQGELGDEGVSGYRLSALPACSRDNVENPFGKEFRADSRHLENGERRLRRRLQHERIAGREGHGDLEGSEYNRCIPRNDAAHHTDRLPPGIAKKLFAQSEQSLLSVRLTVLRRA